MPEVSYNNHCSIKHMCQAMPEVPVRYFYMPHPIALANHPGGTPNDFHFTDEKMEARIQPPPPHEMCIVQWEDKLTIHIYLERTFWL